jgi:hypothetical protein
MRLSVALGATTLALCAVVAVNAEELKSGLQVGQSVPAFQVVKCGGAEDGIKVGQQLCYR